MFNLHSLFNKLFINIDCKQMWKFEAYKYFLSGGNERRLNFKKKFVRFEITSLKFEPMEIIIIIIIGILFLDLIFLDIRIC